MRHYTAESLLHHQQKTSAFLTRGQGLKSPVVQGAWQTMIMAQPSDRRSPLVTIIPSIFAVIDSGTRAVRGTFLLSQMLDSADCRRVKYDQGYET
jgi:hypothetical protein